MPSSDLAERAAALLSLTAAPERALRQLCDLAASQVPGCAAASAQAWRDGELAGQAASHPDLPRLLDVQLASGSGPVLEAMAGGGPASCPDTLASTGDGAPWPEFRAAALALGVRCAAVLSYDDGRARLTLCLHGTAPRGLEPGGLQLAGVLAAYGGALLGALAAHGDTRRLAAQLREAAGSRALVDQAKGILMHALRCSEADALARIREVSQRSGVRASEVARRVIDGHAAGAGR